MAGVIFLDFDGPIFPQKIFLFPENNGPEAKKICEEMELHPYVEYWKADPVAIAMLNNLFNYYPYDLVISSSWADDWLHQKNQIQNVLDKNCLEYTLHPSWRTPRDYEHRHEQIVHWLELHPSYQNNYIIIDDIESGKGLADKKQLSKCGLEQSKIFLVDIEEGLTFKDYKKMSEIVKCW